MKNKIMYYSSDKLYKIKSKLLDKNSKKITFLLLTIFLTILSYCSLNKAINLGKEKEIINYKELGNINYKVYLKDNNYYENGFLEEGMQYIASLIKTINIDFNYKIKSTDKMNYKYKYKINSELQITEKNDNSKILYTKKDVLLIEKILEANDDDFLINEDIDINYDKYNDYVSNFKHDYGLTVNSNLIITLEVETYGNYNEIEGALKNSNKMQINIPLNEQTVNITINSDQINNDGSVTTDRKFTIKNIILIILGIILLILTGIMCYLTTKLYLTNYKNNIYKNKLNKILRDYDRLIVSGKTTINENNYPDKVYIDNFEDMVDVSERLNKPILFYEVIKNEKSFFIIVSENTIYKYRLTKAYLEKNGEGK